MNLKELEGKTITKAELYEYAICEPYYDNMILTLEFSDGTKWEHTYNNQVVY